MRDDLAPGNLFPDVRLPDTTGRETALSELARGQPLVLAFVRGWWCPKEQVRLRNLVGLQDEIQREFGRLAAVTVDEPYVNGAFRAGLGGAFPFLSDVDRKVGEELDLLELTDETHLPFLPFTFVLDSKRVIRGIWCGFWYWGNPTSDELRLALARDRRRRAAELPAAGGLGRRRLGAELGCSPVDGRPWVVRRIEEAGGRTATHVSKEGRPAIPASSGTT